MLASVLLAAIASPASAQAEPALPADEQHSMMELLGSPSLALLGRACETPADLTDLTLKNYCTKPDKDSLLALAKLNEMQRLIASCGKQPGCGAYVPQTGLSIITAAAVPEAPFQFPTLSIADALKSGLQGLIIANARSALESLAVTKVRSKLEGFCDPKTALLPDACALAVSGQHPSFASLKQAAIADLVQLPATLATRAKLTDNRVRFRSRSSAR